MNELNPKPIVGVAFEPFDGTNFVTFNQRFRLLCASKGYAGIFDAEEPATAALRTARELHDMKARGDLGQLVLPTFIGHVAEAESTLEALNALEEVFNTHSSATIDLLSQQIEHLKLKDDERVNSLVNRAKTLDARLTAAGRDIAPAELARKVLRALPAEYSTVRDITLYAARGPENPLTLDGIMPTLLTYEQTVLNNKASRPKAFFSGAGGAGAGGNFNKPRGPARHDKTCHYCNK